MHPSRILALGVGNTLLTDEGAGPRAADRLAARAGDRPGLTCLNAGTLSFTLAEAIATADGLKVVGSNPTPATKFLRFTKRLRAAPKGGLCVFNHRGSTVEAKGNKVPRAFAKT